MVVLLVVPKLGVLALIFLVILACKRARMPAFGWHQGPVGPSKTLRAYLENFVTDRHTLRLFNID